MAGSLTDRWFSQACGFSLPVGSSQILLLPGSSLRMWLSSAKVELGLTPPSEAHVDTGVFQDKGLARSLWADIHRL